MIDSLKVQLTDVQRRCESMLEEEVPADVLHGRHSHRS